MARAKKVVRSWPTMDVVAAACAAQRINGEYVKMPYKLGAGGDSVKQTTNRELVYQFLEDDSQVLDTDRLLAENIKSFYQGYTFKLLSGDYVSDYDRNILSILEQETCTDGLRIALLASITNSYYNAKKRDDANRRVKFSQGGYLGNLGERVSAECEVIKCVFSKNYYVHFVTAITPDDQALFFSYKEELPVGKVINIVGRVKRQDNNQTQLNRVKIV